VFHLALLNQVLNHSRDIFDRNTVIDATLVKQIDDFRFEAF